MIFKSAKNFKEYNDKRKTNENFKFNDYLPKKFQKQRKPLLPLYKEPKKNKQNTVWKALDGNYTSFINNKKVDLIS